MNTIFLTRHLLVKDLRYLRTWVALLWAFALLLPVMARLMNGEANTYLSLLASFGFFLLVFHVLARVIRLDAPGRGFHFLATRPVPWNVLLTGKILFVVMFLMVPAWIAKVGSIFMLGIPVNALDVVLILVENTIHVGALLAIVALFLFFFRGLLSAFFAMFVAAVIAILLVNFEQAHQTSFIGHGEATTLGNSRGLIMYLGLIAVVAVVALVRYRTKSILKPLAVLAAGLALTLTVTRQWNYDLSQPFAEKPQAAGEVSSPLRDGIKLTLTVRDGKNEMYSSNGSSNGIKIDYINHEVSLAGVEPPYFATLVDYHAEATLKSGRTISSTYQPMWSSMSGEVSERMRQELSGFTPMKGVSWNDADYQIFSYRPGLFEKEELTDATIKGVWTLEIRKAVIFKTMPFKAGVKIDMPRRVSLLKSVAFNGGAARYQLVTNSVVSTLRGDVGEPNPNKMSWLVFNRSKGECLGTNGSGGSSTYGAFFNVDVRNETLKQQAVNGDGEKGEQPIPADWADNAEISFFTSESCGRIDIPYEVKNATMEH